ncbi:MAG: alkaline phosphatase family protein [Archaeoglobaceae archaeon]
MELLDFAKSVAREPEKKLILLDGVCYETASVAREMGLKVRKMKTVFPSSTAPAVTSIATLKDPFEHGVIEWSTYVPEIDCIIEPLLFRTLNGRTLKGVKIFEGESWLRGRETYTHWSYANSEYTKLVFGDAKPFVTFAELCYHLSKCEGFAFAYVEFPDLISHIHADESVEAEVENSIRLLLENDVEAIVFSDHGQVRVDEVIYLDFAAKLLKRDSEGNPVAYGGPRVMFMKSEKPDELAALLDKRVGDRVEVAFCEELDIPKKFCDVVVLPKDGCAVWLRSRKELKLKTAHGGMSKEEMNVPVIYVQ